MNETAAHTPTHVHALIWLACNILSIILLAFYSMLEMACVSFNKIRLQYYVSKGYKRAIWLNDLLQDPAKMFGTTLIGVNIALVVGSECAREFYSGIGLNPDWAPLTQVILVVVFGELAPMFAARHYAEHVAMIGIPFIYASAKILSPILACIGWITRGFDKLLGITDSEKNLYVSQEELQKLIEGTADDSWTAPDSVEFNAVTKSIFSLRTTPAKELMDPLSTSQLLPSTATVGQMRSFMARTGADFLPLYHRETSLIVSIAYPREVLRASDSHRVRDYARPPWFVTETTSIMQLLRQFRTNNQSVAVIINSLGKAVGLIQLKDILEEIFSNYSVEISHLAVDAVRSGTLIDKTFPAEMTVKEFADEFEYLLDQDPSLTLAELMTLYLGHEPEKGEVVYLPPLELSIKESSLLDIKSIRIVTRINDILSFEISHA